MVIGALILLGGGVLGIRETPLDYSFNCSNIDIMANGAGVAESQPQNLSLNVPGNPILGLLYWELRGQGDSSIDIDGYIAIGDLIAPPVYSGGKYWTRSYSYIYNFTSLLSAGANLFSISGLTYIPGVQLPNAVFGVVVYEDPSVENIIQIND